MNEKKNNRFMPLLMAVSVVVGILIGTFYANHFSGNRLSIINSGSNKLNNLLRLVDDQYVDTVNVNDLVEKAMPQILHGTRPALCLYLRQGHADCQRRPEGVVLGCRH